MSENQDTLTNEALAANERNTNAGSVPLMDIVYMTLHNWPWILLSIFICMGIAYLYILRTPKVYTHQAELLVKDDNKGKSINADEFADLGFFQNKTNIQNEMTNIKSLDLMDEVVKRLNLDVNYFTKGSFHDVVAYGESLPVKLTIAGFPEDEGFSLNLAVAKNGDVTLSDIMVKDGESYSKKFTGKLNSPITTPIGKIIITPTYAFIKDEAIDLKVVKTPISAATKSYAQRLNVSMSNEKGTVLKLTMSDQSVQRADDALNTLINVYNEAWIRDKNQIAVSTSSFINDRLGVIEGELGNVDSDISSYKSANLIPDVDIAASMYMNQSQKNQDAILELNNQLQMANYIRTYLQTEGSRNQLLPANTGLQSNNVQTLIGDYNNMMLERKNLIAKSSEDNPLVHQYDDQLASQRHAILSTIDNEIVNLRTQLKALQGSEAATIGKLASNPTQAKNLLSVERQQKVKESLYLFLLQKREENELSQAFTAYNTRVINSPRDAGLAPTPNSKVILAMSFLIGLFIPFGFTYVKETFNTKVRGRKDVENLKLPFLGEIPQYGKPNKKSLFSKKKEDEKKTLVVKPGKRDIINEAFRVLRTNLEFMKMHKNEADVVAITSFNPGSGKSFLTMNLAKAIALKDKKVLVIDGDMRHGSASSYIGSPGIGLSDVLNGSVNVDKAIVTSEDVSTLQIIPIGTVPPNPTELLESPKFKELLDEMRTKYDYVFVDCPPIEVVADAQIIDRQADRTIFVLRAGLLERTMLPQLEKIYDEKKYKNMAYILNGTRNDQGRYGYSHSYRYGYGYGYGYGYSYDGSTKKKK